MYFITVFKNKLTIDEWVYFWILNSVSLVYMSMGSQRVGTTKRLNWRTDWVYMSILCQQHTVSITVTFNKLWNWNVRLLQFCSSFSELFWPFGSLAIAYECKDHLFHFCKHFWNVDRDCVESVNRGITILTILSFLIHEYRTSFRLFQSSFFFLSEMSCSFQLG